MAKIDSIIKGSVDLWPVLRTPPAELASAILDGDHDGYLSELLQMAEVHLSSDAVTGACRARAAAAAKEKPGKGDANKPDKG